MISEPKKCFKRMQGGGPQGLGHSSKRLENMAPNMATLLFGVENMLKEILRDISDTYTLPYEELEERYLIPKDGDESSEFTSPPPKPKAKPRVKKAKEGEEERPQCKGLTTKKTQCKKFALAGGVYCACHQKKADEGEDPSEVKPKAKPKAKPNGKGGKGIARREKVEDEGSDAEVTSPTPKKKGKAKVTSPPPAPVKGKKHTHPIDEEEHDECEMCAEQGNAGVTKSPQYTVGESARTRLKNILAAVQMDQESGSETEDE